MTRRRWIRFPFLLAVAILAAAIGNPIVELSANSGAFGPGFADTNQQSVLPALIGSIAAAIAIVGLRCRAMWRGATTGSSEWLRELSTGLRQTSRARDVPWVFGLQLCAVYAMQAAEHFALGAPQADGGGWLGGPVLFALPIYAAVAALCGFVAGRIARRLLGAWASTLCGALAWIRIVTKRLMPRILIARALRLAFGRCDRGVVQRLRGRAPPIVLTFA